MATISLQCNSLSQIHSNVYFRLKLIDRAYMGEVLTQVWLKSIKKLSELFDKEVNAQKESFIKKLPRFTQVSASLQKVCDENERNKEKMMHA